MVLEVHPPLVTLALASGCGNVIASGSELPRFDVHAPLLSLPGIFQANADNMADQVPYLATDDQRIAFWERALAKIEGLRVGIAWQGNPQYQRDRARSIPLSNFAPLAGVPGVQLLSLQRGFGKEQLADAKFAITDLAAMQEERGGDFLDTAALVKNLDLVIACDTALAHLAGALGVPCWIALCALRRLALVSNARRLALVSQRTLVPATVRGGLAKRVCTHCGRVGSRRGPATIVKSATCLFRAPDVRNLRVHEIAIHSRTNHSMSATTESLKAAQELGPRGRSDEAERIARQILATEPHNFGALRLLGGIARQRGRARAVRPSTSRKPCNSTPPTLRRRSAWETLC